MSRLLLAARNRLKWASRNFASAAGLQQGLPETADAVIIGGGSIGCNTLYHLTKLGMTNVILLEKHSLTAGTTWHTAGLLWRLRPSDTEIQLLAHGRNLIKGLEQETGVAPGWIENGGLFIASSKPRLDEYKRLKTIGHDFGVVSHVLTPEETKRLYPLMNVEDVYGTLYSPGDGTIDPAGYCQALTRAAKGKGAQVYESCSLTGIQTTESWAGGRKVSRVDTNLGSVKTECVINCSGAWAPKIGDLAGVAVPLTAMKHAYVLTERIEGIQNMPNVRDHDSSVYMKLQGDALALGGYEEHPVFLEQVLGDDFAFSLYELDWDVFGCHIKGAINRVPVVEATGIKSTVCGPESFTPDHKPIMGEDPGLQGFYHGCAMNSAGMMLGGGCGWQLAEWVIQGRPSLDMFGYDIRRFHPNLIRNRKWVTERSHEAYAKNYSIVFPHDEPLAGRNANKGPLYETLLSQGCVYQDRQGFERPGWFLPGTMAPPLDYDYYGSYQIPKHANYVYKDLLGSDYTFDFPPHHKQIAEQCKACRTSAAVFDMSYFGKFYLSGPDAQKCADYVFTNNVQRQPGTSIYSCMLNPRGGIESDLTVSVLDNSQLLPCEPKFQGPGFYVAAGGGSWNQALSHIMSVVRQQKFDVQVHNATNDMALISLQGPKSRDILQKLVDVDLSNDNFPFSTNKIATVAGRLVRLLRLTFAGELGWELHVPNESAVQVYHAVMAAGKPFGIANAGYRALDCLSIEKVILFAGMYIRSLDNTPISTHDIKEGSYELEIMCDKVKAQVHTKSPFDPTNQRIQ
ncbi:unnamed protein product, partial [Notodromas monacha]